MTTDAQRQRLSEMAQMVVTAHSARLTKATTALQTLEARLSALDRYPSQQELEDLAVAGRQFGYECWAAERRALLHLQLEASRLDWKEAHRESCIAVARYQLLQKLR